MKAIFDLVGGVVGLCVGLYLVYLVPRVIWSIGRSVWWSVRDRRSARAPQ
jgi:hypothetical protein